MGSYSGSTFGKIKGKVGDAVATIYRGIKVVKSMPAKSSKAATTAQLDQRSLFRLVIEFLSEFSDLIKLGYQSYLGGKLSPMNVAVRYHLENAVTGVYPNYEIDYPKVVISEGGKSDEKIDSAELLTITPVAGSKVAISWDDNPFYAKGSKDSDLLTALFYSPTKNKLFEASLICTRSALSFDLPISRIFGTDPMHVWMLFSSADGKLISESSYMGTITLLK